MPNYDLTNLALQISAPANVLMYDDMGDPSVMVRIPKFTIGDVIAGGGSGTHPAFIVNGVEKDSIYISKYQNIVNNGRAYSLPMQDPAAGNVNFDQAWGYCKAKGPGWHLMTNAEWAAVALWCKKNGFMPKGNNTYGKDASEGALPQKALPTYTDNATIFRTATGSGFKSWYHDNTEAGIADLNGNVWEWNSGMRLNGGEIQILPNNDAADWNNPITATSTLWRAIMPDGTLVAPGTAGTLKWDYAANKITLATTLATQADASRSTSFETLGLGSSVTVPMIMKALALHPAETIYEGDTVWMNNVGERVPLRGGHWDNAANAGVFALYLGDVRSDVSTLFGFRAAFCSP
ncbi:MAG: SUMF1/EgtB/PvdO family nonheme iron enzyme [Bacteroides sp.]